MAQRVFWILMEGAAADQPLPALDKLAAGARRGTFQFEGDDGEDAWWAPLGGPAVQALADARQALVLVHHTVGILAPFNFRGVDVLREGKSWVASPEKETHIPPLLADCADVLDAALVLARNEPWDLLGARIQVNDAAQAARIDEQLATFVGGLTADVTALVAIRTAENSGRFFVRWHGVDGRDLGAVPAEDFAPTALFLMDVPRPKGLPGKPLALEGGADSPGGYTTEDEVAIQKRLEDLGYL